MAKEKVVKPAAKPVAKAAAKPAAKPVAKAAAKPVEKVAVEETKQVKEVHELKFVKGKGWAVMRQGSDKVIKYFKTKVEATEYVVKVSENQKTSVVIHLKNGKFQKFDNALRALSYAKTANEED